MFLMWSSFKDMSKVEYLQNLWCYMDAKRKKNNRNELDIFHEYIDYNIWFICIDGAKFFPDVMYVYKKNQIW